MCQCSISVFGEHFSAWHSSQTAVHEQCSFISGIFRRPNGSDDAAGYCDRKMAYSVEVQLCVMWSPWTCSQGKKIILKGAICSFYHCWEIGIVLLSAAALNAQAGADTKQYPKGCSMPQINLRWQGIFNWFYNLFDFSCTQVWLCLSLTIQRCVDVIYFSFSLFISCLHLGQDLQ